jgi:phage/plasmid-associated DNA primase
VVDNALEKYLLDSDSVAFFVREMGYRVSEDGERKMNDLFGEYKEFCLSYGNQNVSYRTFCARLKNLGNEYQTEELWGGGEYSEKSEEI